MYRNENTNNIIKQTYTTQENYIIIIERMPQLGISHKTSRPYIKKYITLNIMIQLINWTYTILSDSPIGPSFEARVATLEKYFYYTLRYTGLYL